MGVRNWRFTAGVSVIRSSVVDGTDYWFVPAASSAGARSYLIRDTWEYTQAGEVREVARRAFETRLETLAAVTGRTGLLEIDFGTADAKSFTGVRFNGVRPIEISNNVILKYDLEFEFPISGQIARALQFGADADGAKLVISAGNFVLNYDVELRRQYKYPFRAAPVRIEGGPGLKVLRVTSIQQSVTDSTALVRRQSIETIIRTLIWTYKGLVKPLKIDGAFLLASADFELQNVTPSDLSLPDSITYDLEFVTGFVA